MRLPAPSRRVRVLVLVLALPLAGGGAATVLSQTSDAQADAVAPQAADPGADSPRPKRLPQRSPEERAVQKLLDARAEAVLSSDRDAFLKTVDPRQKSFRRSQGRMLDALAEVPLTDWSYVLQTGPPTAQAGSALLAWGSRSRSMQVRFRYGMRGETADREGTPRTVTVTRRGGRFFISADEALNGDGTRQRYLWDEGPVAVAKGRRSLVLGHPGSESELRSVADAADAAVPNVSSVWGRDWSRRVVVVLPDTQAELGRLTGSDADEVANTAGVAVSERTVTRDTRNDTKVFLNPVVLRRLDARQRRMLLAHEVTHVATAASNGYRTPDWLVEGLAEHVEHRASGLTARQVAVTLGPRVRAGRVPRELPTDTDLDVADRRTAAWSYEASWLAVELLVERYGTAKTVRLYRAIGASDVPSQLAVDDALDEVLGSGEKQFTKAWRKYLVTSLG